jgi:WXG100 family type VII secretion target
MADNNFSVGIEPFGMPNPFINIINSTSFQLFDNLLVTPDVLVTKADAVLTMIKAMRSNFEELESKINGTASYWQGEASEVHREKYQNKKEDMEEAFKRLIDDTEKLRKMAAVYTAAENEALNISTDLPGDVIV